jgi:hypothetical protein
VNLTSDDDDDDDDDEEEEEEEEENKVLWEGTQRKGLGEEFFPLFRLVMRLFTPRKRRCYTRQVFKIWTRRVKQSIFSRASAPLSALTNLRLILCV